MEAFRIQKRYAALKKTTIEEVGAVRGVFWGVEGGLGVVCGLQGGWICFRVWTP